VVKQTVLVDVQTALKKQLFSVIKVVVLAVNFVVLFV
jgi:hypothetical protein